MGLFADFLLVVNVILGGTEYPSNALHFATAGWHYGIMATFPRNDKSSDVDVFPFLYKLISSVLTGQIILGFPQRFRFGTEVRKLANFHSDLRCLFLDGCMWMPFPREPCGWKRNGEGVRRINRFLPFTTAAGSRRNCVLKNAKKNWTQPIHCQLQFWKQDHLSWM